MTPRQRTALIFITEYYHEHGYGPTLEEIGRHMGVNKTTVHEHVAALMRQKLLSRTRRHMRRGLIPRTDRRDELLGYVLEAWESGSMREMEDTIERINEYRAAVRGSAPAGDGEAERSVAAKPAGASHADREDQ